MYKRGEEPVAGLQHEEPRIHGDLVARDVAHQPRVAERVARSRRARYSVPVNLFDIVTVVARRS